MKCVYLLCDVWGAVEVTGWSGKGLYCPPVALGMQETKQNKKSQERGKRKNLNWPIQNAG